MSVNATPWPGASDDRQATVAHQGLMPKLGAPSATLGGFTVTNAGRGATINTSLASASNAGAMTPAAFSKVAGWPLSRLDYTETADVLNATAITANTQTQVVANQNFTVNSTAALLVVEVRAAISVTSAGTTNWALRANIDSAGTPVLRKLGGAIQLTGDFDSLGGGSFVLGGLAAGTHTIKLELIANTAGTAYCRASSLANFEFAGICIQELTP